MNNGHCSHFHDWKHHTTIRGTSRITRYCVIDKNIIGEVDIRPDGKADLRLVP